MVRRRLSARGRGTTSKAGVVAVASLAVLVASAAGCGRDRNMAETMEMPDTTEMRRALQDPAMRDALLDTMPGGEMVRGDSGAEQALIRDKMP